MPVSCSVVVKHPQLCHAVSFTVSFSIIAVPDRQKRKFSLSGELVVCGTKSEIVERVFAPLFLLLFLSVLIC